MLAAVFGNVGDFVTDGFGGRGNSNGTAFEPDLAALGGRKSEDGFGQLGAAGADQSRESEDFAGADFQRYTADAGAGLEIAHFQRNLADGHGTFGENSFDLAPHHHADEFGAREAFSLAGGDSRAVAQHSDTIGDGGHLFEAVRNINDAGAFGAYCGDDLEEARDF